MPTVAYRTVDVFTSTRFGGNPLAVIPDARGLSDDEMQHIATEFNYSETSFALPPHDPANTAQVRIFTPTNEIPFAGHPNVGTAYVLAGQSEVFGQPVGDVMHFEEGAGLVRVRVVRDEGGVVGAEIRAPKALELGNHVEVATVSACASLTPDGVVTSSHVPVIVSVGLPFVVAEVKDLATLAKAAPDAAMFARAEARYPHPDDRFSLFLYARLPDQPGTLRARMFAPLSNIPEDPATGSASAALGAYLLTLRPEADLTDQLDIVQGVEMGRRSVIRLRAEKVAGSVENVFIGGDCVGVMQGTIQV